MDPRAVRQRVVAADRDEHVDLLIFEHPEGVIGEVERPIAFRLVREEVGNL